MKKNSRQRVLKQMAVRKNQKDKKKVEDIGKQHVTRKEMQGLQSTSAVRIDTALMGIAAIAEILVKNKLCTYEDVKNSERGMLKTLNLIRKTMSEAYAELGIKANPETIMTFVHEKVVESGVNKDLLINIFGIRPSKSRIIMPGKSNGIIATR